MVKHILTDVLKDNNNCSRPGMGLFIKVHTCHSSILWKQFLSQCGVLFMVVRSYWIMSVLLIMKLNECFRCVEYFIETSGRCGIMNLCVINLHTLHCWFVLMLKILLILLNF